MFDVKKLNDSLLEIIEKKNQLGKLDYSDETYDEVEDQLHDLEDSFNEEYGEHLEDILHDVHDELCPDSDVLLPFAYLSHTYIEDGKGPDGKVHYKLSSESGVPVEVDDYPQKNTRLLILPNPARIVLVVNGEVAEECWVGGQ